LLDCTAEVCTEIVALISRKNAGLESVFSFTSGTENHAHSSRKILLKYRLYSSALKQKFDVVS
jgi:hypothetical protein